MSKIRVAFLFGGRSAEHQVSTASADNVLKALDKEKYDPVLIHIDKQGRWHLGEELLAGNWKVDKRDTSSSTEIPPRLPLIKGKGELPLLNGEGELSDIQVIFPLLHGPYGEDGSVQGLAKLASIPCVGAGILASAAGMDKDIMRRLFQNAGIPGAPYRCFTPATLKEADWKELTASWGSPLYVKPCNLGSSVGISRVEQAEDFLPALREALGYDTKVMVEKNIQGREIECAVLGNQNPKASVCGEISLEQGFYSYGAKYRNEGGPVLTVPASLPPGVSQTIQDLALTVFSTLECRGMARVDFFLTEDNQVLVNEINTIPGFTKISMYPRLWEASGISYTELVDRLITLAIEEHQTRQDLRCDTGPGD